MKARRTARVAFIASLLAATPLTTTLAARAGALTGTCSTGNDSTTQAVTLAGTSSFAGDIAGEATGLLGIDGVDGYIEGI